MESFLAIKLENSMKRRRKELKYPLIGSARQQITTGIKQNTPMFMAENKVRKREREMETKQDSNYYYHNWRSKSHIKET